MDGTNINDIWPMILALAGVGAFAGFSAGLFGIGGGAIIVPALYYTFSALGVPQDVVMHVAVATSAATIIVTSLRSASGHTKKGAVDWDLIWPGQTLAGFFKGWGFWIALGSLLSALIVARYLSGHTLTLIFAVLASLIALQLVFGRPDWRIAQTVPTGLAAAPIGLTLGGLCSLMGIGFGSFGVTFMLLCGKTVHRAIGTAAALGTYIGVPATLGFIISGWGVPARPAFSLGYVNLAGFAVIAAASFVFAPLGVKAAHALPQAKLRRLFGICLFLVAANMLRKVLGA